MVVNNSALLKWGGPKEINGFKLRGIIKGDIFSPGNQGLSPGKISLSAHRFFKAPQINWGPKMVFPHLVETLKEFPPR